LRTAALITSLHPLIPSDEEAISEELQLFKTGHSAGLTKSTAAAAALSPSLFPIKRLARFYQTTSVLVATLSRKLLLQKACMTCEFLQLLYPGNGTTENGA